MKKYIKINYLEDRKSIKDVIFIVEEGKDFDKACDLAAEAVERFNENDLDLDGFGGLDDYIAASFSENGILYDVLDIDEEYNAYL